MIKNILTHLFALNTNQKRFILISSDCIIIPVSVFLSYAARLETHEFIYNQNTYISCVISLTCILSIFLYRGVYSSFTRHISIETAFTILSAFLTSAIVLFLLNSYTTFQIPRSVPFIHAAFGCIAVAGLRFFVRAIGQHVSINSRTKVVIYGAGSAGRELLEALKWNDEYQVCQIIDDDKRLQGKSIAGVEVQSFDKAKLKFKSRNVETILLAQPFDESEMRRRIGELLNEMPIKVKQIPNLTSLITGRSNITQLRDLAIEDLLERKIVRPNKLLMGRTISKCTVLVTGAGGSIGSELCRQIIKQNPNRLIIIDISEIGVYNIINELQTMAPNVAITPIIGSILDRRLLSKIFKQFDVDTLYHAAAYKHVPLMEQNIMQCISNNVIGTLTLVEEALKSKVKAFIFISTDKAVNPTNFMGASKRIAELVCRRVGNDKSGTRFAIVRFGNVLGSSGSVVPLFKSQIAKGGPVTVTHKDIVRYFMTIPEAAQLVIQAGSLSRGNEIFVLDMGQPQKIYEIAQKMIILSGKTPTTMGTKIQGPNDIQIMVTGLRPGEKLYEELSYDKKLTKTEHPRILRTTEDVLAPTDLDALLDDLLIALNQNEYQLLFETMRKVCINLIEMEASTDVFI